VNLGWFYLADKFVGRDEMDVLVMDGLRGCANMRVTNVSGMSAAGLSLCRFPVGSFVVVIRVCISL
jgi:hypothetical protein